jgi:hypothetical protein
VKCTQLGDQFCCVFGSIDSEGLGDDIEGLAELGDGNLFLGIEGTTESIQMHAKGSVHCTSTCHYLA